MQKIAHDIAYRRWLSYLLHKEQETHIMRILITTAIALLTPMMGMADRLPLAQISDYLDQLETVQGQFTQINDDGSISTGALYMKRPGRVRFEYDPPESALVVAGSNTVVIYDKKSNQPPESYPLRRTPLSLILAQDVDLEQADMVTGHDFDGTATIVTAQDPEHPEYGNIQLKFTADPVELRQWVINNANGSQTTVILGEMTRDITLANRLFDIGLVGRGEDR